jgi:hypothetical protein
VVVVQLLTTNDDAPREYVGAGIRAGKVAVTDRMTQTVDHTGGPERNPGHLDSPDRQAQQTEQEQINTQHDGNTQHAVFGVQVALEPVIGVP